MRAIHWRRPPLVKNLTSAQTRSVSSTHRAHAKAFQRVGGVHDSASISYKREGRLSYCAGGCGGWDTGCLKGNRLVNDGLGKRLGSTAIKVLSAQIDVFPLGEHPVLSLRWNFAANKDASGHYLICASFQITSWWWIPMGPK